MTENDEAELTSENVSHKLSDVPARSEGDVDLSFADDLDFVVRVDAETGTMNRRRSVSPVDLENGEEQRGERYTNLSERLKSGKTPTETRNRGIPIFLKSLKSRALDQRGLSSLIVARGGPNSL